MISAGASPRMMAQKTSDAGISREPTGAVRPPVLMRVLADRDVAAGRGDHESLLRDADALDRHSVRELGNRDGEIHQAAQHLGRYPARVNNVDIDLIRPCLGDLSGGRVADRAYVDGRLDLVRAVGGQRDRS